MYIIVKETEEFIKKGNNKLYYQCIIEEEYLARFTNIVDAKTFIDNFSLECDKEDSYIYVDGLVCYETDHEDLENRNEVYSKHYSYKEIEDKFSLEISWS